jgi:hypothetical protein
MYANLPNYKYHALSQAKPCYALSCRTMRFILEFIFIFITYHRATLAFTFAPASQAKPRGAPERPPYAIVQRVTPFLFLSFPFHFICFPYVVSTKNVSLS